ncbi:MAG: hypothetical protein MI725_09370 [Pirellulales bacterium]|nr:hypothetical protein [Pirellulales bacterium]
MARDDLKALYHELRETRFDFVPRGEHNIRDVYTFVQNQFPHLCDDSYLCSENCKSGYNSPEWKHKVRTALWDLRRHTDDVRTGSERGLWIFGKSENNGSLQLIANDLDPPSTERIETTTFRILRDTALARQIKELHQHQCQICGLAIELPDGCHYAEAHHIQPLGAPHDGPDIGANIIVLCPNHHAMCDYGVIALDMAQLRIHPEHEIGSEFIDYHNAMVYVAQTPT